MAMDIDQVLAERRALLDRVLPRLVDGLVVRGARLVVLFGSEGREERRSLADLDLLAVMDSDLPFVERVARLYQELMPGIELDLLVYTPQEFSRMRERPFIKRVLNEGRVLHVA